MTPTPCEKVVNAFISKRTVEPLAASEKHVTRKENQLAGINSIVEKEGNRTAAVLPLPEYGALLDQLLEDVE